MQEIITEAPVELRPTIVRSPIQVSEATLASIVLDRENLSNPERRAILAAEALPGVDLYTKGIIAAADIFVNDGEDRVREVLGDSYYEAVQTAEIVDAIKSVREVTIVQFEKLREDLAADVALLKRYGFTLEQIAQNLEITQERTEAVMHSLDGYGLFGNKKPQEVIHFHLREKVAKIDTERKRLNLPLLSNAEIGEVVGRSGDAVSRYRAENRALGEVSTLSPQQIMIRNKEVDRVIMQNPSLLRGQIVNLLKALNVEGVTDAIVDRRRMYLKEVGLVEGKGHSASKGKSRESIIARKERAMRILIVASRQYLLHERDTVIFADFVKKITELSDIPYETLLKYFKEIPVGERPEFFLDRTRIDSR